MVWFHPVLQVIATMFGIYAGYLGMERFLSQHLGKRTQFLWQRHVLMGRVAITLWLLGMVGGMTVARLKWQVNFVTGDHYRTAFIMFPFLIVGLITGIYMDRRKARRTILPLLHGACNLIALTLALYQIVTGWHVIRDFIL
ncbi:DUF4079 family protein [Pseudodesulfovibrio sp. zrk46]|uniref:DUF4079 family protein n=1 Tax=Pseudodesulfovibrio sp. zrk46 TaxID=2725288 RepID=UPI0014493FAD|nr:DUF4079 family protein [Pseudodesulfovibrio sp. zrk46]QJB56430.1 DUF4079 family protein [Pseudodesulfovibrio sp. zrk46]